MRKISKAILALPLLTSTVALAATPPDLVAYQGVLRNAADKPQSGTFDMVLRLYDAASSGSEILVDSHTGGGNAVTASNGLFTVQLGGGTVSDGLGPGTYTSLSQVFRDYGAVWLEVTVGSETLSPRIRVQSSAYALGTSNLQGHPAAYFLQTTSASQTKLGALTLDTTGSSSVALNVSAQAQGGVVTSGNSYAYLANNDQGMKASGSSYGGIFQNGSSGTYAYLGTPGNGVQGYGGSGAGGTFQDGAGDSASAATGAYGVSAAGSSIGGGFFSPASGWAKVADAHRGITASGNSAGGYFADSNNSGYAVAGDGDYGVYGYGSASGASFATAGWGASYAAAGGYGFKGYGKYPYGVAGYFKDSWPYYTAEAYLGYGDTGILAYANGSDPYTDHVVARFDDNPSSTVLDTYFDWYEGGGFFSAGGFFDTYYDRTRVVSYLTASGLDSSGSKNFLQNDPADPTLSIAYACLEGDEVGTYTRGSSRLVGGEAHVKLSETFKWVTNPDVGLTAQLTPRGGFADLYIASLTTEEMVVRSADPSAGEAEFDYRVNGLRIGFDEVPAVQPRKEDAPLPAREEIDAIYAAHAEIRGSSPRARFLESARKQGAPAAVDFSRSEALEAKIRRWSPNGAAATAEVPGDGRGIDGVPSSLQVALPITGPVEAGDLLVTDALGRGFLQRSSGADQTPIVGIATDRPSSGGREMLVAVAGVVPCNVDASFGSILPGDLLTASKTPGRAMAMRAPHPGPVVGKALEPLAAGTGTIRVLVLSR